MKKLLLVLFVLLLCFGAYIIYDNYANRGIPKLKVEEEKINIDELFIYGTHLNLHGNLVNDKNVELVLYNGEFQVIKINKVDNTFNLSNYINDGFYLEDIDVGTYFMFLRSNNIDEKGKDNFKYYTLNNNTKYKDTIYYTFSNKNNKIVINQDNDYNTLMLNVTQNTDNDIYDVVIDPGHGGMDSGAHKYGVREADVTLKIALNLKQKLEAYGVKVKLTREENQLTLNEKLPDYGVHGRAVINHEVKAKYVFSIHMNSNADVSVNGLEVYAPANINYDFARILADNIKNSTNSNFSKNKINKVSDGIYTRVFTEKDVENSINEYKKKDMIPYDVSTKSNYYFMIRETGGIMTGAYVDNRNDDTLYNPYYNSNIGSEAYLLELAYLSNKKDLENMSNNMDLYTEAIANSFKNIFEKGI